jgi:hypothetical protein
VLVDLAGGSDDVVGGWGSCRRMGLELELAIKIVKWRKRAGGRGVVDCRLTLGHFEAVAGDDGVGGEGTTGPLQEGLVSMDKYDVVIGTADGGILG